MSLFRIREHWGTQAGATEEYDGSCLCVANVDNDPAGTVNVIVGSIQGMLRVFLPRGRAYKPEDLLLEAQLEQAILQLEVGRFSTAGGTHLAVLHPRKLVVYSLQNMGHQYLQLTQLYEHQLDHSAANMCHGPFGGVQGFDSICVQSYDGQLSFMECESFAFSRFLPGFLIPGPLAYVEAADLIVTASAGLELEAYKYKTLTIASADKQEPGQAPGLQVGKRVQQDWRTVLGETAIDIRTGKLSAGLPAYKADIVVLCEHHVFVLSSTSGQITFQKRLDYHPACGTTYPAPGAKLAGGADNLLIASHNRALLVYRGNMLCWAARMETQPVAVCVADVGQGQSGPLRGMIVTLTDSGQLQVSYLGTEPMINSIGWAEGAKELDYEAMSREQRSLAAIIREHTGGRRTAPPDRLILRAQVPSLMDHVRGAGSLGEDLEEVASVGGRMGASNKLTVRLYLSYQGGESSADNVELNIRPPEPMQSDQECITVPLVRADSSAPCVVSLRFSMAGPAHLPWSSTAHVTASFTTNGGAPRGQHLEIALPLCLFTYLVPPVKNAAFKVTVTTNRAPPLLSALFEDMLAQAPPSVVQAYAGLGATVLSFSFPAGADVTILVSKSAGRYRLQSDHLEAIWLVLLELQRRLTAYYAAAEGGTPPPGEGPLAWSSDEPLPLQDVFEVVDAHFAARVRCRELRISLEQHAVALRAIEKRLLMRFKDKAPSPLNQLDVLLEDTYARLMADGSAMEAAQEQVTQLGLKLGGVVQLLVLLTCTKFALLTEEAAVLRSALSPSVVEIDQQGGGSGLADVGWEEFTEAAMTQLLRSCLARNAKESAVPVTPLAPAPDTIKLKKHLSLVLERLAKGMRMTLDGDEAA